MKRFCVKYYYFWYNVLQVMLILKIITKHWLNVVVFYFYNQRILINISFRNKNNEYNFIDYNRGGNCHAKCNAYLRIGLQ